LVAQGVALGSPLLTKYLIDQIIIDRAEEGTLLLLGIAGFALLFLTIHIARGIALVLVSQGAERKISRYFVQSVLRADYGDLNAFPPADLIVRNESVMALREIASSKIAGAVVDILVLVGFGIALSLLSWPAFLVMLIVLILEGMLFVIAAGRHRRMTSSTIREQSRCACAQLDILTRGESLRVFATQRIAFEKWVEAHEGLLRELRHRGFLNQAFHGALETIRLLLPIAIVIVASAGAGATDVGTIVASMAIAAGMIAPLSSLANAGVALQEGREHLDRVLEFGLAVQPRAREGIAIPDVHGTDVALRDVSFSFPGSRTPVLSGVSVTVPSGSVLGIIGPSGAGKTTLGRILAGLLRPSSGNVLIGGHPPHDYDDQVRAVLVALVPQELELVSGTIRDNISLGRPSVTEEAIWNALEVACFKADVEKMPLGLDTVLLGAGGSLSNGQRRRMAVARAVALPPKILILDEVSNGLDGRTCDRLLANLLELDCTTVFLSHDPRVLQHVDRRLVIGGLKQTNDYPSDMANSLEESVAP
jgi:ATP-binding cassette subfamily C protein LapB